MVNGNMGIWEYTNTLSTLKTYFLKEKFVLYGVIFSLKYSLVALLNPSDMFVLQRYMYRSGAGFIKILRKILS